MEAMKLNGRRICEIFLSVGPSELLVVNKARWEKYQRDLVAQEEVKRRRALEKISYHQRSLKSQSESIGLFADPKGGRSGRP